MKKSFRNFVIAAVSAASIFGVSAAAFAGEAQAQFVQTDMNFRSAPSKTATIIGSVPAGAKVDVKKSENGWDLITFNGTTGYIHGGNLGSSYTAPTVKKAPAVKSTQTTTKSTETADEIATRNYFDTAFSVNAETLPESGDGAHRVVVDNGYLALRSAPTYESDNEIAQLHTGDLVERTNHETHGSYIEVYSPKYDAYGFVNAGFVE